MASEENSVFGTKGYAEAWQKRAHATRLVYAQGAALFGLIVLSGALGLPGFMGYVGALGLAVLWIGHAKSSAFECPRCHEDFPIRYARVCSNCGLAVGDLGLGARAATAVQVQSLAEARELAVHRLREVAVHAWWNRPAVLDSATIEKDWGWVFVVSAKRWLKRNSFRHWALGNQPIVVRRDGVVQFLPSKGDSLEDSVADYERWNQLGGVGSASTAATLSEGS